MKKLLYIVPILVFAMVVLTQDAKAQTQTGNASNAITQGATNAVVGAALTSTSTGGGEGGATGTAAPAANGTVVAAAAPAITVTVAPTLQGGVSPLTLGSVAFPPLTLSPVDSFTIAVNVSGQATVSALLFVNGRIAN